MHRTGDRNDPHTCCVSGVHWNISTWINGPYVMLIQRKRGRTGRCDISDAYSALHKQEDSVRKARKQPEEKRAHLPISDVHEVVVPLAH